MARSGANIDPLLGRFSCHAPWPMVNPILNPASYATHIPFIQSESTLPFLRYSNLNILPWKSKVKFMGEVKFHNVSLTFYRHTSLWFQVNRPSHSWDTAFSKVDLGNPWSRSWRRYNTLSTHTLFVPCPSALPFLGYSYFKIWRWKFKVKDMGEVKVWGHNMGPTSTRLTPLPFHVNRASNSWVTTFSKFVLENQGPRSWVRSQFKVTM